MNSILSKQSTNLLFEKAPDVENPTSTKGLAVRARAILDRHSIGVGKLNFDDIKNIAMESCIDILERWLPDGELQHQEYVAHNPTRNDGGLGSFKFNTATGKWADFATADAGGDIISLVKYVGGFQTKAQAAIEILNFIADFCRPEKHIHRVARYVKDLIPPPFNAIMPIPDSAPTMPLFFGAALGSPTTTWTYRNANGETLFYVNRFDTPTGKVFRPLCYGSDESGHRSWQSKAPQQPRPPYGLDRLAARPDAPVLFVEGEKCADAAQILFPEFVAVTTMNGSQSPQKSDFTVFSGRNVYIAPDFDEAGNLYKDRLIGLLGKVNAKVVGIMRIEKLAASDHALPAGYDLADVLADPAAVSKLKSLGHSVWDTPPETSQSESDSTTSGSGSNESFHSSEIKKMPEAVTRFVENNFPNGLIYVNGEFYGYKDGYWPTLEKQSDIRRPLAELFGQQADSKAIKDNLTLLADFFSVKKSDSQPDQCLICLRNGTFDTRKFELIPHSPLHRLRSKIDIDWSPDAKCDRWIQFIDEIFLEDHDRVEKKEFLQEFFGYCLVPDTSHHLWVLMVGAGGNGKSIFLGILSALLGGQNVSQAHIERLGDKHVRAELENKLVNISSEMSANATVSDGYLKQIVSGDEIEAERKFQNPFSFQPYVRLIGATNNMPRLLDLSEGFFRRLAIIKFNRQFSSEQRDPTLMNTLKSELPGIFQWGLVGLSRLRSRKRFVLPASAIAAAEMYKLHSDPVQMFAISCLEKVTDGGMKPSEIREGYVNWCRQNGFRPKNSVAFGKRLGELGYGRRRSVGLDYWLVKPIDKFDGVWRQMM